MRRIAAIAAGGLAALVAGTAATAGVQALITGAQIEDGTVGSRDIRNGTIVRADIAPATLGSLRGRRGMPGPTGPAGPPGPATPIEYTVAFSPESDVHPGQVDFALVQCPPGTLAFSPGHTVGNVGSSRLVLVESFPVAVTDRVSGWQVTMLNLGTATATFTARAYCLRGARLFAP